MSNCPHTGITQPECSCARCLTEQIRVFQPTLLEADPRGEIRIARTSASPPPPRTGPVRGPAAI